MARAAKHRDLPTQKDEAAPIILREMNERLSAAQSQQEFTAILDRTVELLERIGYSTVEALDLVKTHE